MLLQDHQEVLHYGEVSDLLPAFWTAHVKKKKKQNKKLQKINMHVLIVINKVCVNLSANEVSASSAPSSTLLSVEERSVTSAWRWKTYGQKSKGRMIS